MYTLNNPDIAAVSGKLEADFAEHRISDQNGTRIRLSAEEILLKYAERFGRDTEFDHRTEKRFGSLRTVLSVRCDSFDPIDGLSEEEIILQRMMESSECVPVWSFRNGINKITFTVRPGSRLPSWAGVAMAAAAGIIGGLAARALPQTLYTALTEKILDPVSGTIMGFFGAVAGLMIAMSIISGIVSMGNVATLNRIGKKLIRHIFLWMGVAALIVVGIVPLVFPIVGGAGKGFDYETVWGMLLDIVPDNLIAPFSTGNTLQIVFLAAFTGYMILRLAGRDSSLGSAAQSINLLVQEMIAVIVKAIPLVVFISLFELFGGKMQFSLASVYKLPVYLALLSFGWLALTAIRVSVTRKVRLNVLIKKLLPTFLIAFSTASSAAALPTSMETCEKKLGIGKKLVDVGVPISNLFNKPISFIERMVGILCMAELFHIDVTWSSLISMAITAFIFALSTPTVPGAGISVFTLMAQQFGVPMEAVSIIIALDVITDRIATPAQVSVGQLELIQIANSLGSLNIETLRNNTDL